MGTIHRVLPSCTSWPDPVGSLPGGALDQRKALVGWSSRRFLPQAARLEVVDKQYIVVQPSFVAEHCRKCVCIQWVFPKV